MLLKIGFMIFFLGCMAGDSDSLYLPGLLIVLGICLIAKGGGFRYDDEIDEH